MKRNYSEKNIKSQKNRKKELGITLVAMVVTIIILLILTGVTLNIALSDNGLFDKTQETVDKYKDSEDDEENALNKLSEKLENINIDYNDYIGAYVDYTPKNTKECIIESTTSGSATSQKFTTKSMKWRIWDYDENTRTVRLISENPTSTKLTLEGATGYNNGVWAINEICRKCYGQYKEDGTMKDGINVANLRRSDIQKVSNYDYTNYKREDGNWEEVIGEGKEGKTIIQFGETGTYSGNKKYPNMWLNNDKNWKYEYSKELGKKGTDSEGLIWESEGKYNGTLEGYTEENNTVTCKESYYAHDYKVDDFKNPKYYDLIFKKGDNSDAETYWLAGRYVNANVEDCVFGIQYLYVDGKLYVAAREYIIP